MIKKLNAGFIGPFALVFVGPASGGDQNQELCLQRPLRIPV
jgi:hypothetical protein